MGTKVENLDFPVAVGQKLLRSELHKLVGGSFQQGMTSCLSGTAFLLFHNEKVSKKFGYDKWEGRQIDDSFLYTGQGVRGDQKLTRGNKGLIESSKVGNPIHLFESVGKYTTYIGQVDLRNPFPDTRKALDESGTERNVFVFHLEFLGKTLNQHSEQSPSFSKWISEWKDPIDIVAIPSADLKRIIAIDLLEFKIQSRFGKWASEANIDVKQLTLSTSDLKGSFKPDFFLPDFNLIIEAKASATRNQIRTALGQVLDYVNLAKLSGFTARGAILIPELPATDLVSLLAKHDVGIIYEDSNGFSTLNYDYWI